MMKSTSSSTSTFTSTAARSTLRAASPSLLNRATRVAERVLTRSASAAWPLADRLAYGLCWITGIGLFLITVAIVLFMLVKGVAYLRLSLFVQSPAPSLHQSQAGGFLDPIVGTLILTAIGTLIAAPLGVALAASPA